MDLFNRITQNTEEVVGASELKSLMKKSEITAYLGTAPTGSLHTGYFFPVTKISDILDCKINFTILLADIHAHLDDIKSPFDLIEPRTIYYETVLKCLFEGINADTSKLNFVRGTSFELKPKYSLELLKLVSLITYGRAKRAGAEVVRQKEDPRLGSFVYPLMQALDVAHLHADIALGGIDQRGIYMLAREFLPKIGYKKPICIFTPLLPWTYRRENECLTQRR